MKKVSLHSGCLHLITSVLFAVIIYSCTSNTKTNIYVKDDYKAISNYLLQTHKINLNDSIDKLFVLTENGCHSCNKKFSDLVLENINNDKSIFIITATGDQIDMTPFEIKHNNVLKDRNITDTALSILNETKIIYFRNNKIDTIITINALQLEHQFEIIHNRK